MISIIDGGANDTERQERLVNAMLLTGGDESKLPELTRKRLSTGMKRITYFGSSFVSQPTGFIRGFQLQSNNLMTLKNAGNGGDTTQDLLDRLSDVPAESDLVLLYESNSDAGAGVTALQHAINIKALITELQNAGHLVIYVLGSPLSNAGKSDRTYDYRFYDWVTCKNLGVQCFDIWTEFANNDGTGFWMAGASVDGTHPTIATYGSGGTKLAEDYKSRTFGYPLTLRNDLGLIPNALMLNDANADNLPDNFASGAISSLTLAETPLGLGNTLSMTNSNVFSFVRTNTFIPTPGKRYALALRFSCSFASVVDGEIQVYLSPQSGGTRLYALEACSVNIDECTLYSEFIASDTSGYQLYFEMNGEDYTATFNIAQLTLWCIDDYTVPENSTYLVGGVERSL